MTDSERRRCVRHPLPVPVAVRPRSDGEEIISSVADLGEGGLAFSSPRELPVESTVDLALSIGDRAFALAGSVASCQAATPDRFRIGVAFLHPGMSFRMKLAEQVLRIHRLRSELAEERGCEVGIEEAAREWVARYAETFAGFHPS